MDYKITYLKLRLKPYEPVNMEEFYRAILTALGLKHKEHKFVNSGKSKHFFSTAYYKGVYIKLPYYETMSEGFLVEITEEGLETVSHMGTNGTLIENLCDLFLLLCDLKFQRIDIDSHYIPNHIQSIIHKVGKCCCCQIGGRGSSVQGLYYDNKFTYSARHRAAEVIIEDLLCNDSETFAISFKDFVDNWKPKNFSSYCHLNIGASPALRNQ